MSLSQESIPETPSEGRSPQDPNDFPKNGEDDDQRVDDSATPPESPSAPEPPALCPPEPWGSAWRAAYARGGHARAGDSIGSAAHGRVVVVATDGPVTLVRRSAGWEKCALLLTGAQGREWSARADAWADSRLPIDLARQMLECVDAALSSLPHYRGMSLLPRGTRLDATGLLADTHHRLAQQVVRLRADPMLAPRLDAALDRLDCLSQETRGALLGDDAAASDAELSGWETDDDEQPSGDETEDDARDLEAGISHLDIVDPSAAEPTSAAVDGERVAEPSELVVESRGGRYGLRTTRVDSPIAPVVSVSANHGRGERERVARPPREDVESLEEPHGVRVTPLDSAAAPGGRVSVDATTPRLTDDQTRGEQERVARPPREDVESLEEPHGVRVTPLDSAAAPGGRVSVDATGAPRTGQCGRAKRVDSARSALDKARDELRAGAAHAPATNEHDQLTTHAANLLRAATVAAREARLAAALGDETTRRQAEERARTLRREHKLTTHTARAARETSGFVLVSRGAARASGSHVAVGDARTCMPDAVWVALRSLGIQVTNGAVRRALPGTIDSDPSILQATEYCDDAHGVSLERRPALEGSERSLFACRHGLFLLCLDLECDSHDQGVVTERHMVCFDAGRREVCDNEPRAPVYRVTESDVVDNAAARRVFIAMFPGARRIYTRRIYEALANNRTAKRPRESL